MPTLAAGCSSVSFRRTMELCCKLRNRADCRTLLLIIAIHAGRVVVVMPKSIVKALARHATMGAALGFVLALALIWIRAVPVVSLTDHGMERWTTMLIVACTLVATFGVDATLTGFLLLMVDDDIGIPKGIGEATQPAVWAAVPKRGARLEIERTPSASRFRSCGLASGADEAIRMIEDQGCGATVLDVRLADGTTARITQVLAKRSAPFVLYSAAQLH